MIRLTDAELDVVLFAARPLARSDRDAFMQAVANALAQLNGCHGEGDVFRAIKAAQKMFFDPPLSPNTGAPLRRGSV